MLATLWVVASVPMSSAFLPAPPAALLGLDWVRAHHDRPCGKTGLSCDMMAVFTSGFVISNQAIDLFFIANVALRSRSAFYTPSGLLTAKPAGLLLRHYALSFEVGAVHAANMDYPTTWVAAFTSGFVINSGGVRRHLATTLRCRAGARPPQTWTTTRHDDPNHLGL